MLTRASDVPEGIDALAAVGTLTKEDYEKSIGPILDHARRTRHRVRLLIEVGPGYDGHTAGALWEKAVNASRSPSLLRLLDGYAVVTDHHRRIRRIALTAYGRLADLAPHLAGHFVHAEINSASDRRAEAGDRSKNRAPQHP